MRFAASGKSTATEPVIVVDEPHVKSTCIRTRSFSTQNNPVAVPLPTVRFVNVGVNVSHLPIAFISAAVGLEFPEPAKRTFPDGSNGQAFFEDGDGTDYYGTTYRTDGTTFQVHVWDASSTYLGSSNITNTIPFTWATSDRLVVSHWYQRA